MAKQRKIVPGNPRIKERLTIFGNNGSGKSSIILQILEKHKDAHAWIIDLDYSMAVERLIWTEHPEIEDRITVKAIDAIWDEFVAAFEEILEQADMDNDWLVIDPATITWQMVQSWFSEQVHGNDIASHMVQLRKETKDIKEFNKELTSDMTWPIINKLYQEKFYGLYRKWRGHVILVCEATAVRKDAEEAERAEFGFVGAKPAGQKSMGHVGATNVYLDHPKIDIWRMTTTKDRGRELQEKVPFDDFAVDYLVDVAGWEWEME